MGNESSQLLPRTSGLQWQRATGNITQPLPLNTGAEVFEDFFRDSTFHQHLRSSPDTLQLARFLLQRSASSDDTQSSPSPSGDGITNDETSILANRAQQWFLSQVEPTTNTGSSQAPNALNDDFDDTVRSAAALHDTPNQRLALMKLAALDDLALSGNRFRQSEVLSILENYAHAKLTSTVLPSAVEAEKEAILFSAVFDLLREHQETYALTEFAIDWEDATFSSENFPQIITRQSSALLGIQSLHTAAITFPLLEPLAQGDSVEAKSAAQAIEVLLEPVSQFCNTLAAQSGLSLFATWFPYVLPPLPAVDKKFCLTGRIGTTYFVRFSCLQNISLLKVRLGSIPGQRGGLISVKELPVRLSIFVRTEETGGAFECVGEYNTLEVKQEQGSWTQLYTIDRKGIREIRVLPSGWGQMFQEKEDNEQVDSAPEDPHYSSLNIEAFTMNDSIVCIDGLTDLHRVLDALFPLLKIQRMRAQILRSILSVLSSAGSVSLFVHFALSWIQTYGVDFPIGELDDACIRKTNHVLLLIHEEKRRQHCLRQNVDVRNITSTLYVVDGSEVDANTFSERYNQSQSNCPPATFYKVVKLANDLKGSFLYRFSCSNAANLIFGFCHADGRRCGVDFGAGHAFYPDGSKVHLSISLAIPGEVVLQLDSNSGIGSVFLHDQLVDAIFNNLDSEWNVFYQMSTIQLQAASAVNIDNHSSVGVTADLTSVHLSAVLHMQDNFPTFIPLKPSQTIQGKSSVSIWYLEDLFAPLQGLAWCELLTRNNFESSGLNINGGRNAVEAAAVADLSRPFTLELTHEWLKYTTELFSALMKCERTNHWNSLVRASMLLLETTFHHVRQMGLSLRDILLPRGRSRLLDIHGRRVSLNWEDDYIPLLVQLQTIFSELMRTHNSDIATAALFTYGRGSAVLVPNPLERLTYGVLMRTQFASSELYEQGLCLLVESFLSTREMNRLINAIRNDGVVLSDLELFLRDTIEALYATPAPSQITSPLYKFLDELLFALAFECAKEKRRQKTTHVLTPTCRAFLILGKEVITSTLTLIRPLLSLLSEDATFDADERAESVKALNLFRRLLHVWAFDIFPRALLDELFGPLGEVISILTQISQRSSQHRETHALYNASMPLVTDIRASTALLDWVTVPASFESPTAHFSVSSDGQTYTALSTTNTCAVVNCRILRNQRAAWEFQLETDTIGDECSLFGAARLPLTSRCYSSSTSMWMRRSYNGYLYRQGSMLRQQLPRITVGDIVRVEYNGPRGTLSYSVNGEEPIVAFTDVHEDLYPTCSSYREQVRIRLLCVQFYRRTFVDADDEFHGFRPLEQTSWVAPLPVNSSSLSLRAVTMGSGDTPSSLKSSSILTPSEVHSATNGRPQMQPSVSGASIQHGGTSIVTDSPNGMTNISGTVASEMDNGGSTITQQLLVYTARANRAAPFGVHEWTFSIRNAETTFAVGVIIGTQITPHIALWDSKAIPSAGYMGSSYVLKSDGWLYHNGEPVGEKPFTDVFLSCSRGGVLIMRVDRRRCSLSFRFNSNILGVAFGPPKSLPFAEIPLPSVSQVEGHITNAMFPVASVDKDALLTIRPNGINGSTVLPSLLRIAQSTEYIYAIWFNRLMNGPTVTNLELDVIPWLQSPIFRGGVDGSFLLRLINSVDSSHPYSHILNEIRTQLVPEEFVKCSNEKSTSTNSSLNLPVESFLVDLLLSSGMDLGEMPSEVIRLYDWFESLDSESAQLRKVLERSGAFRFPDVELPFLAVLLRYGDLCTEALRLSGAMITSNVAESSSMPSISRQPSVDLRSAWQKVRQLRLSLRQQRQAFRKMEADRLEVDIMSTTTTDSEVVASHATTLPASLTSTVLGGGTSMRWITNRDVSLNFGNECLSVVLVGVDTARLAVFLKVRTMYSTGTPQPDHVLDARLTLGGNVYSCVPILIDHSTIQPNCTLSTIWFDLRISPTTVGTSVSGNNIRTIADIRTLLEDTLTAIVSFTVRSITQDVEIRTNESPELASVVSFQDHCRRLSERCLFMALMKSCSTSLRETSSHAMLLSLSSRYSTPGSAAENSSNWRPSANTTYSGRGNSSFSSMKSGSNKEKESGISVVQAIIRASFVFLTASTSGGADISRLRKVFEMRIRRAKLRSSALKRIREIIDRPEIARQPATVTAILSIAAKWIPPCVGAQSTLPGTNRRHYLTNLEGCSSVQLAVVQKAFERVYESLTQLLARYVSLWTNKQSLYVSLAEKLHLKNDKSVCHLLYPFMHTYEVNGCVSEETVTHDQSNLILSGLRTILGSWFLRFSSRDVGWILRSQIMVQLRQLNSLALREPILIGWGKVAKSVLVDDEFYGFLERSKTLSLSPSQTVLTGVDEIVPYCSLHVEALDVSPLLPHMLSGRLSPRVFFYNTIKGICSSYPTLGLKLPLDPYLKALTSGSLGVTQTSQLYSSFAEVLETHQFSEAQKRATELKNSIESQMAGTFDATYCGTDFVLSEDRRMARCTDTTNRAKPQCVFANLSYTPQTLSLVGNYFEVQIFEVGDRAIGVGLADRYSLNTMGSMPGWETKSYAYHGDDGSKYGAGKVERSWPRFEVNDIIGCGIDFEARTIFYTRNGRYLGVAFQRVSLNSPLWPVVGFCNRVRPVSFRINFGQEPFIFTDSQRVVVNALALKQRTSLPLSEAPASIDSSSSSPPTDTANHVERTISDDMRSEPSHECKLKHLNYCHSLAALVLSTHQLEELDSLQRFSSSVLRYFLMLFSAMETPDEGADWLLDDEHSLATSTQIVETTVDSATEPKTPNSGSPTSPKEVSVFGTPRALCAEEAYRITGMGVNSLVTELSLAARFLIALRDRGQYHNSIRLSNLTISVPIDRATSSSNISVATDSTDDGSLDFSDINRSISRHLRVLSSLLLVRNAALQDFCAPQLVASLLTIVDCSAHENSISAIRLLSRLLPTVDPALVENCVPDSWKRTLEEFDASSLQWHCASRVRRIPEALIRYCILRASRGYAISTHTPPPNLLVHLPTTTSTHKDSSSNKDLEILPFGYGDSVLEFMRELYGLLQTLFQAPLWQELVARSITNAVRDAHAVIRQLGGETQRNVFYGHGLDVVLYGLAAVTCMTDTAKFASGTHIITENGIHGTVISSRADAVLFVRHSSTNDANDFSYRNSSINVIPSSHSTTKSGYVYGISSLDCADPNSLRTGSPRLHIDFSKLSQPLLQQITSFAVDVIQLFQKRSPTSISPILTNEAATNNQNVTVETPSSISSIARKAAEAFGLPISNSTVAVDAETAETEADQEGFVSRVCLLIFQTLSSLMQQQPDLLGDAILDAGLLPHLLSASMSVSSTSPFDPTLDLGVCWQFSQARILEGVSPEVTKAHRRRQRTFSFDHRRNLSPVADNKDTSSRGGDNNVTTSSIWVDVVGTHKQRLSDATNLSSELGLPISRTLGAILFANNDVSKARQILNSSNMETDFSISMHLDSEYDIDHDNGNSISNTGSGGVDSMKGNPKSSHRFNVEVIVDRLEHAALTSGPEWFSRPTSTATSCRLRCLTTTESRKPLNEASLCLSPSQPYFLACVDGEGLSTTLPSNLFVTSDKLSTAVSFSSREGVAVLRPVSKSRFRLVDQLFGHLPTNLSRRMKAIDTQLAILSIRSIVQRLLLSGTVDLVTLTGTDAQAVQLLKLFACQNYPSGSQQQQFPLPTGCLYESPSVPLKLAPQRDSLRQILLRATEFETSPLRTHQRDLVPQRDFLGTLIRDLETESQSLGTIPTSLPTLTSEIDDTFRLSSPHPFTAPYSTAGRIDAPHDWKGMAVFFHPHCETPSQNASLSFYTSLEDADADRPIRTFYGPNVSNNANAFRNFHLSDATVLYYRFTALPCSNLPILPLKIMDGCSGNIVRGTISGAIPTLTFEGLGEEDNLAAMFPDPTVILAKASSYFTSFSPCIPPTLEGHWQCEFQIITSPVTNASHLDSTTTDFVMALGLAPADSIFNHSDVVGELLNSCGIRSDGQLIISGHRVAHIISPPWVVGCCLSLVYEQCPASQHTDFSVYQNGQLLISTRLPYVSLPMVPTLTLNSAWSVKVNFGEEPFILSPPPSSSMALTTHSTEPSSRSFALPMCHALPPNYPSAWGIEATITSLQEIELQFCYDFTLLAHIPASHLSDTTTDLWIWRPKVSNSSFVALADIITRTPHPPLRTVVSHKSFTKPPLSYSLISSLDGEWSVYRLVPPPDYVVLGDVLMTSKDAKLTTGCCIPRWAVIDCSVDSYLASNEAHGVHPATFKAMHLWEVSNGLQFFFGTLDGANIPLGAGYSFDSRISTLSRGHWYTELQVSTQPSIAWVIHAVASILQTPLGSLPRKRLLQSNIFSSLVVYIHAQSSIATLQVLPVLVDIVRAAHEEGVNNALPSLRDLCKDLLTQADLRLQRSSNRSMSPAILRLVDFVIEVQRATAFESCRVDCLSFARKLERYPLLLSHRVGMLTEFPQDWSLVPSQKITANIYTAHRLLKPQCVEGVFSNSSLLGRLKQVLKLFLTFLSRDRPTSMYSSIKSGLPKTITGRFWYDIASTSQILESSHPHNCCSAFTRRVFMPGATKIYVLLDSRTSLNEGDILTITGGKQQVILNSGVSIDSSVSRPIKFSSNELVVSFFPGPLSVGTCNSEPCEVTAKITDECIDHSRNEDLQAWGWSILFHASGPVFHSTSLQHDLSLSELSHEGSLQARALVDKYSSESTLDPTIIAQVNGVDTDGSMGILNANTAGNSPLIEDSDSTSDVVSDVDDELSTVREVNDEPMPSIMDPMSAEENELLRSFIHGLVIHTGTISVPYASQLSIQVRLSDICDGVVAGRQHAILLTDASLRRICIARLLPGAHVACKCPGSMAYYHILALALDGGSDDEESFVEDETYVGDESFHDFRSDDDDDTFHSSEQEEELSLHGRELSDTESVHIGEVSLERPSTVSLHLPEQSDNPSDIPLPTTPLVSDTIAPSPVVEGSWSCAWCTFINPPEARRCEVCEAANLADTTSPDLNNTSGPQWFCTHCTTLNSVYSLVCSVCAAPFAEGSSQILGTVAPEAARSSTQEDNIVNTVPTEDPKNTIFISAEAQLSNCSRYSARVVASIASEGTILTPLQLHLMVSDWTLEEDEALLDYLNSRVDLLSTPDKALPHLLSIPRLFLMYRGRALENKSLLDINARIRLLLTFNRCLESLWSLTDLACPDPRSVGALIRDYSQYILLSLKTPTLEKLILSTNEPAVTGSIPARITLDNLLAIQSRELGDTDISTSQNCFAQCFAQLRNKPIAVYRYAHSDDRVFQVSFLHEEGIDAGGVFREGLSRIIDDLFSEHFSLFLLCPNGQQVVHSGQDKYVPNVALQSSALAIEMFEFVGKLIGVSIRAKLCLPFALPLLIWKRLLSQRCHALDLCEIDIITARQLEEIEKFSAATIGIPLDACEEDLSTAFLEKFGRLVFTYVGTDGHHRELLPGGATKEVTFANRCEYCELVVQAKLLEFDFACNAIRHGLSQVIPETGIVLFSASQLEELACGTPHIDFGLWKANTEVNNLSPVTVQLFWKVLESLTSREQQDFIRFAWGRSRLPARQEHFRTKMRLNGSDRVLPQSHTCFFTVELPNYRTEEEMRRGLLTAVHFGVGGILIA